MDRSQLGRIGVALGCGSAKGWAHIGVLRVLDERGLSPSVVCGSSIGAVVGAAYAAGKLDALEAWVCGLDRAKVRRLLDFTGRGGLIRAERVIDEMAAQLDHPSIDSLRCDFCAVATDLRTGREVWLRDGSLSECLRASAALPGLITPVRLNGRWLVDGGLVNPVPISPCRALGADTVIAVDLNSTVLQKYVSEVSPPPTEEVAAEEQATAGQVRWADYMPASLTNITADLRERFQSKGDAVSPPAIYEVMPQGINIMQVRITRSRMAGDPPDVLVTPDLGAFTLLDFDRAAEAIDVGRAAAEQALSAANMT